MKKIFNSQNFELNINEKDMMLFCLIAAAKGLTPETLLECFTHDIVSYFSSEDVSIEDDYLARWFFGSWFSQDDNKYFSFLQYIIRNRYYKYVVAALNAIRDCDTLIIKRRSGKQCTQYIECLKHFIKKIFKMYCAENSAHKSLSEEIKIIEHFEKKHRLSIKMDFNCLDDIINRLNMQRTGNKNESNNNNIGSAVVQ